MGTLILIELKGLIVFTVSKGEFTGCHVLMVFLGKDGSLMIKKVIESTRVEMMEIRAEVNESGDDG